MHFPVLADFSLFVGRFHPLVVHLPIGFLLLAVVLEWWPGIRSGSAVRVAWILGGASAILAAVCGWLLAAESGGGDTLFWHRWLGVSVAVLSIGGIFVTGRGGRLAKAYGIVVAAVLGLAGHLGGSLTHGEDYLYQYAPGLVHRLVGHAPDSSSYRDWSQTDLDSITLYATFLQPALDESCVRCHGPGEQRGGLRLDAPRFAYAGGDDGPLFEAGEPLRSHWVERVTLPRDDKKAMPPGGDPWTYTQVELLRHWIAEGADTNFVLDVEETPEHLKVLLRRDYGLDLRPRRFVETVEVQPLQEVAMNDLRSMGWQLAVLQPDGGALEVQPKPGGRISGNDLRQLAAVAAAQVIYLNLDDQPLDDADLAPLLRFTNLNRLRLSGTRLTNITVERLVELAHLESLNLYETQVDDGIFQHLPAYPKLERLYLWQTNASLEAAAAFASTHPRITVDTGIAAGAPPASQTK